MVMAKLTLKQKMFADEYIRSGNAVQSAIRAGYSENYAKGKSYETLANEGVKAYIDEQLEAKELKNILSQQEALMLLKDIAFGEMKDKQPIFIGEGVQELVDVPAPTAVRMRAIESMLKRYDVAGRDTLLNRKLELEIKKLEMETETEETIEDKLDVIIGGFDELAENGDD